MNLFSARGRLDRTGFALTVAPAFLLLVVCNAVTTASISVLSPDSSPWPFAALVGSGLAAAAVSWVVMAALLRRARDAGMGALHLLAVDAVIFAVGALGVFSGLTGKIGLVLSAAIAATFCFAPSRKDDPQPD